MLHFLDSTVTRVHFGDSRPTASRRTSRSSGSHRTATMMSLVQRLSFLAVALSIALFTAGCEAAARDIFVNNLAGDDLLDGTLPTNTSPGIGPFHTITRALRAAGPGDRIDLANTGEPYRESVSLVGSRHSGNALRPFTIEG